MSEYTFSAEWCRAAADEIERLTQRLAAAEADCDEAREAARSYCRSWCYATFASLIPFDEEVKKYPWMAKQTGGASNE